MSYDFPKHKRLITSEQFRWMLANNRQKIVTAILTFYFCSQKLSYSRLGVIVPKKHVAKSSMRIFFKRIIREFFRLNQEPLFNSDLLVIVNRKIVGFSKIEIKSKLREALAGAICQ